MMKMSLKNSALMSKDEHKALQVLQRKRDTLKPLIAKYNGEFLKEIGDGTLSSFTSAVEAVTCAIAIQRTLKDEPDFKIRIGIHIGDVIIGDKDIFGDGVNVASRIEPLAAPGGICISEKVHDDVRNKSEIVTVLIGEKELKNVGRPLKIYALTSEGLPAPEIEKPIPGILKGVKTDKTLTTTDSAVSPKWKLLIASAGIIAIVLIVYFIGLYVLDREPHYLENLVAVADFVNETGDPSLDYLGREVRGWVLQGISQVENVEVVQLEEPKDDDGNLIQGAELVSWYAENRRAGKIVSGSFTKQGDKLCFHSRITAPASEKILFALDPITTSMEEPLLLLEEMRQRIMGGIFYTTVYPEDRLVIRIDNINRPPRYDARLERNKASTSDLSKAKHWSRAFEIDSTFFSPLFWLATLYGNNNYYAQYDSITAFLNEHAEELCEYNKLQLDVKNAVSRGDLVGAFRARKKQAELTGSGFHNWGTLARQANHLNEAIEAFSQISSERPYPQYADVYYRLKDYKRGLEIAQRGQEKSIPEDRDYLNSVIIGLAGLGKVEEVKKLIDETRTMQGSLGGTIFTASKVLWTEGNEEAAFELLEDALEWYNNRRGEEAKEVRLAFTCALIMSAMMMDTLPDDYVGSVTSETSSILPPDRDSRLHLARDRAMQIYSEDSDSEDFDVNVYINTIGRLGCIAVLLGDTTEIQKRYEELSDPPFPSLYGINMRFQAYIMALLGDFDKATDLFEDSFRKGYNYRFNYHIDIELEELRKFPRFQEFLRPKG
ncbi:adenylate/guanylate cyclase domain-containing protein [candidate division KSB1 bacterium]